MRKKKKKRNKREDVAFIGIGCVYDYFVHFQNDTDYERIHSNEKIYKAYNK